jgi:hypothetical protein
MRAYLMVVKVLDDYIDHSDALDRTSRRMKL